MPALVVLETGPSFVEGLRRAWDAGNAAAPLDRRLPPPARAAALEALRPDEPVEPGDALVVTTSGSTGAPKGVVLTHAALGAAAIASDRRLDVDPATDRWYVGLPLSHMGGLGVVVRGLLGGTPVEVGDGVGPDALASALLRGATLTALVPTAMRRVDATPWRRILLGGAAAPAAVPTNVVRTYGLTETCGGCVYDGVAFDGVEVRIAADGEIHLRGPVLLRAYRDGTDPRDPAGWLPTGDSGHVDAGGRLVIDGRMGDLVVTGGENVWPAAVEQVLRTHPGVVECVVGGRPDPEWGERVVAWIVATDEGAPPSLDALRDHVKAALPAWCAPREVVVVADLPRTASGKVRRRS